MMRDLRESLRAYLLTKHPRVYFENAPDDADWPYLVIEFQASFTPDEGREQLIIDIDGWDKPANGDTTPLEDLMQTVNGDGDLQSPTGLDRQTLMTDETLALFRLESRLPIKDDDKTIKRRKYSYTTTVYERRPS